MNSDSDYASIANQTLLDICNGSVKSFNDVTKHFLHIEDEHKYSETDGANIPEMNPPTHRTLMNDSNPGDKCSFQAMVSKDQRLSCFACFNVLRTGYSGYSDDIFVITEN
jgi:hypothetical protein